MKGDTYDVDEPGVPASEGETWQETADRLTETRGQIRAAAGAIASHPHALGVDVLEPGMGPHAGWTCEITLDTRTAPPGVLRVLAAKRLRIREARPRGTGFHIIATA